MTKMKSNRYPLYFLLPAFIVFFIFFIVPTLSAFYYSFTNWNLYAQEIRFIGFDNYFRMFEDNRMIIAFKNTLIFAVCVTVVQNLAGLALALALNGRLRSKSLLRTLFFLPYVIAPIIIGYIFKALYHPRNGMFNRFLESTGLGFIRTDWLNNPDVALYAIIATDIWRSAGFTMVIYLAGLQFIPKDLQEAASIDGSGYWGRFRHITFPLLAPAFTINVLLALIGAMKVFEIVTVLTDGGPGYTTEVFYTLIRSIFSMGEMGYATAVNIVLFLLVSGIGLPVLYMLRKREVEA